METKKTSSNPEINGMHLIWQEKVLFEKMNPDSAQDLIMMICSNQNEYMVYNEIDPNES